MRSLKIIFWKRFERWGGRYCAVQIDKNFQKKIVRFEYFYRSLFRMFNHLLSITQLLLSWFNRRLLKRKYVFPKSLTTCLSCTSIWSTLKLLLEIVVRKFMKVLHFSVIEQNSEMHWSWTAYNLWSKQYNHIYYSWKKKMIVGEDPIGL